MKNQHLNLQYKFLYLIFLCALLFIGVKARAATGDIDASFYTTKVCHDTTCTSSSMLNFRPTGATAVVVDDVTGLSGDVWGSELGWIDLNPTGEGVTFADPDTGLLTGKAWSQVSGWINFAVTGQEVRINPNNGEFSGWAWTGGPYGGWIKFDCSDGDTCIKTSWRAEESGAGSRKSSSNRDICKNIEGNQKTIPQGYAFENGGTCKIIIDVCPNLSGDQQAVPLGFEKDIIGACVLSSADYCPNILGKQKSIPAKYTINALGACVPILVSGDICEGVQGIQVSSGDCGADSCLNIVGFQNAVPDGYIKVNDECFLQKIDLCTNISGLQQYIPPQMMIGDRGQCIPLPIDVCSNIGGSQASAPEGFALKDGVCLYSTSDTVSSIDSIVPVVGFTFIPKSLQIPSNNAFLKSVVKNFVPEHEIQGEYKVDVVSVTLSTLILFIIFWILSLLVRRLLF